MGRRRPSSAGRWRGGSIHWARAIGFGAWSVLATAIAVMAAPSRVAAQESSAAERLTGTERSRILEDARRAIERAKQRKDADEALDVVKDKLGDGQSDKLQEMARKALQRESEGTDIEALKRESRSLAALRQAKENASPEAAEFIRRSEAAKSQPETSLVAQAGRVDPPAPVPASTDGAGSTPVPPRVVKNTKDKPPPKGVTTVDATEGAYFTTGGTTADNPGSGDMLAVFTGDVVVNHPSFIIESDQLEVFLEQTKSQSAPGAANNAAPVAAANPSTTATAAAPGAPAENLTGDQTAIKKAIATGREVVIRKETADGKLILAKCRKATYFADTGKLRLEGWPQVQQDNVLVIATESSTQMLLDTATGHHEAMGGDIRTQIVNSEEGEPPTPQRRPSPPATDTNS